MLPVMLDMFFLRTLGNGNGKAVVSDFENRHDEGKTRAGALPLAQQHGILFLSQKSIVSENILSETIFEKKNDDGAEDILMSLHCDLQRHWLTADNPV